MLRRFLSILFIASLILYGLSRQNIGHASSSNTTAQQTPFPDENQTFVTRTPTPGPTSPPPPTATKNSGGGNPTQVPTTVPTSTDMPQPTATATIAVTIAFTPINGFMPTAEPCSTHPTVLANNTINVRLGPSADDDILTKLTYLEVRHIIGRAADAAWWQILLADGQTGWVANSVVIVNGYIGNVPITDGNVPSSWNPTPNPDCPVTPTPMPVATATTTAVSTMEPVVSPTTVGPATEATGPATTPINTKETTNSIATTAPQPTQTAVSPPTLMAPSPPSAGPESISQVQTIQTNGEKTAVTPLADVPTRSTTDFLLPVAGILLLSAGAMTALTKRRQES